MADETHHRDVNHTFADMKSDDPNPYVQLHKENAAQAWRLEISGKPAEWNSEATDSSPVDAKAPVAKVIKASH